MGMTTYLGLFAPNMQTLHPLSSMLFSKHGLSGTHTGSRILKMERNTFFRSSAWLVLLKMRDQLLITADALCCGLVAVLSQKQDDGQHVTRYASRYFAETECLAMPRYRKKCFLSCKLEINSINGATICFPIYKMST